MGNTVGRPRCRQVGIIIGDMEPGTFNAITDVPGVRVGHVTLISGQNPPAAGGPCVRTGVTAILPHPGNLFEDKVRAAIHVINGFGKATGLAQVAELGTVETPLILTNTLSVGAAWNALCSHMLSHNPGIGVTTGTVNPVVLECNDGFLNDIRGRHVRDEHVSSALRGATGGFVPEGNVGAGTGMSCLGFKGGIGTSSRVLTGEIESDHLGVLALCNFGEGRDLTIAGAPVGRELAKLGESPQAPPGSVVVVVATDAPLSERQLGRVARRCQGGLARVGSRFGNGSGDFVVAFSTANKVAHAEPQVSSSSTLSDGSSEMAGVFRAAQEATEEAVLNALFAAETMTGRDGNVRQGLPIEAVLGILAKLNVI